MGKGTGGKGKIKKYYLVILMKTKTIKVKENVSYAIQCNATGSIYYGSTDDLTTRMNGHRQKNNGCRSKQIIETGNYDIIIIQKFDTLDEARHHESELIRHNDCINKNQPLATAEERKLMSIEYRKKNKDVISERQKQYYIDNRESIIERVQVRNKALDPIKKKEYHDNYVKKNKERLQQQRKDYYLKNREAKLEYAAKKRASLSEEEYKIANDRCRDYGNVLIECPHCNQMIKRYSKYSHFPKCELAKLKQSI